MSTTLRISIPANTVSSAISSFSALLNITPANGFAGVFSSIGDDWSRFYIYSSADVSIPISVLKWSSANSSAQIRFIVDIPSPTEETTFDVVFGSDLPQNEIIGAEGTATGASAYDSNTVASWSMCQDPSGGASSIIDGKGLYHGTPNGSMTAGDVVDHIVGSGIDLDGSDDWISLPSIPALTNWSMSASITPKDTTSGDGILVIDGKGLVFSNGYFAGIQGSNVVKRGTTVVNNTPVRLTATWNGSTMLFYVNGSERGVSLTNSGWGLAGAYLIGSGYLARKPSMIASNLSVSNVARGAVWAGLDYLSSFDLLFTDAAEVSCSFSVFADDWIDSVEILCSTFPVSYVYVNDGCDDVSLLSSTSAVSFVNVEEPDDSVSVIIGEEIVESGFVVNVEERIPDKVLILCENTANLIVVDEDVDEVVISASTPAVCTVRVTEYKDTIAIPTSSTGAPSCDISIVEAADTVSATAWTPSVSMVDVESGDTIFIEVETSPPIVATVAIKEPVDTISASGIMCAGAVVAVDDPMDEVRLSGYASNLCMVNVDDGLDRVKITFVPPSPHFEFYRGSLSPQTLVDSLASNEALSFSYPTRTSGTVDGQVLVPLHFQR